jgi:hypothetical protein
MSLATDNPSSLRVSSKFGYEPDGIEHLMVRDRVTVTHRLRISSARWEAHRNTRVSITALAPCLPLLGLGSGVAADQDGGGCG